MSDPDPDRCDIGPPLHVPGRSPFAPPSSLAGYYRPPRLGIVHLLAWTATTAVLLKFFVAMEMVQAARGPMSMPPVLRVLQSVLQFIAFTAQGAGLVGASILLVAKIRRAAGRMQPGHWLVAAEAVASLMFLVVWASLAVVEAARDAEYSPLPWPVVIFGLILLARAGIYSCGVLTSERVRRWRVSLATLAVVSTVHGLLYAAGGFLPSLLSLPSYPLLSSAAGIVLFVTVLLDLRKGPSRDWLHWVGVAMIFTNVLLSTAWFVWTILANYVIP
jgi:hypothetical protein